MEPKAPQPEPNSPKEDNYKIIEKNNEIEQREVLESKNSQEDLLLSFEFGKDLGCVGSLDAAQRLIDKLNSLEYANSFPKPPSSMTEMQEVFYGFEVDGFKRDHEEYKWRLPTKSEFQEVLDGFKRIETSDRSEEEKKLATKAIMDKYSLKSKEYLTGTQSDDLYKNYAVNLKSKKFTRFTKSPVYLFHHNAQPRKSISVICVRTKNK